MDILISSTGMVKVVTLHGKPKRPKMNELSSLQAVAHGADSVQYFQWRKSRGCSEKFHGAVVDHNGTANTRVFKEASELGQRLSKLECLAGTLTEADVAIVYDWSNRWALEAIQAFNNKDKKYLQTLESWYAPFWKRGINTDIIGIDTDFTKYKLIVAPMLYMMSEDTIKKLEHFVAEGGRVVCTYMTAMADENDLCYLGGFPGGILKDVFGIVNEEIDTLYPDESNNVIAGNENFKAIDYCEVIHPTTAEVLARYDSDYYKGMSAATRNQYKKGTAYYIAFRDGGDFTDRIIAEAIKDADVKPCTELAMPYGVTAHSRTDGESNFIFIQNFTPNNVTLSMPEDFDGALAENGNKPEKELSLGAYDTTIIKKKI